MSSCQQYASQLLLGDAKTSLRRRAPPQPAKAEAAELLNNAPEMSCNCENSKSQAKDGKPCRRNDLQTHIYEYSNWLLSRDG